MSQQLIQILISPQGEAKLQTSGFAGSSCKAASADLERALGLVEREEPTPELYFQPNTTPSTIRQQA